MSHLPSICPSHLPIHHLPISAGGLVKSLLLILLRRLVRLALGVLRGRLLILGRWRLLAVLDPVLGRKLLLQFRMVDEALRIGPVVLLAPVALLLAFGGVLGVALAADLFGNAVLVTPPTAVFMALPVVLLRSLQDDPRATHVRASLERFWPS